MSNDLVPMDALERMAAAIAKSGLFGLKTPEQAIALMLVAQAEGLHPATAAMEYDIIQGRPARKSSAMLSRFQASGGKMRYTERTDARVAAVFSHPQGGEIEIDWTMERAKKAGLGGKDNWQKWPRQMLSARVISEGVRAVFPGATGMFYEPGEVADMEPPPLKDVTPPKRPARPVARPAIPAHDPETGEIEEDFMPQDQGELGQREPELAALQPAPEHADDPEYKKAYDWANDILGKIKTVTAPDYLDTWRGKHKDTIDRLPSDLRTHVYDALDKRKVELRP